MAPRPAVLGKSPFRAILSIRASGQEVGDDVFEVVNSLFDVADVDVFIWLVAQIRLSGAEDQHGRAEFRKMRAIGRKPHGFGLGHSDSRTKISDKIAAAIGFQRLVTTGPRFRDLAYH